MPLTSKGKEILGNMKKFYRDPKKAESVFYAMKNGHKLTGVEGKKK